MHLLREEKGEQEKLLVDGDSKFYILLYQNNILRPLWKKKKILGCVYKLSIATYDFLLARTLSTCVPVVTVRNHGDANLLNHYDRQNVACGGCCIRGYVLR
jgi:hypothetical protein